MWPTENSWRRPKYFKFLKRIIPLPEIQKLREGAGKNVFIDGGAFVAQAFLKENLLDEIIVSIIPVLLGAGISLFGNELKGRNLELLETKSFEKGLVQLHYRIVPEL
jgi:dihydrofolate reductase